MAGAAAAALNAPGACVRPARGAAARERRPPVAPLAHARRTSVAVRATSTGSTSRPRARPERRRSALCPFRAIFSSAPRADDPPLPPGDRVPDVDVSLVEIPEDLVGIRAYVRWENAGMPEDTSPEWQATEYAQARLDLQTEVAQGTTLNDIRRRYNQPVVPGDDEPVVIDFATHARTQNNVVQIHTEPDAKADADRARLSEDAATAAAAAEADLAARVAAAAAALSLIHI